MLENIGLLLAGLVILIVGGELLVRGASSIALRLHLSPLVVGLTIVAFGTSAPEMLISIKSALAGSPDLAMGNVVGSNICNLALVLGITTIINPVKVQGTSLKIDWPMTFGASVLLYLTAQNGLITIWEGICFILILIAYNWYIIRRSRRETKAMKLLEEELDIPAAPSKHLWKDLMFILIGCIGLYYGAEWFVGGAQSLAVYLGVTERIIGLTVLALGTSLPELVTACIASFKKETDIALGNLLGSNIFNILSILGVTSVIQSVSVSDAILEIDMLWMLGITFLVFLMMLHRRQIFRYEGIILLGIYFFYTYLIMF
ncbi:calcium/sodium antiporter [Roseivirga sp. BDSF3-8]|uniref:calcium/sodium antiporter n=1 Tax=Roseivirga sp. BDSF3-8 TaxID=3241598 RepID=UPI003531929E